MKRLDGKVAVVTGAASGIGRATARLLAESGCAVACVDVNPSGLAETTERMAASERRVTAHRFDVSEHGKLDELASTICSEHGAVDILVQNAGVTALGSMHDQTKDEISRVLDVNLGATIVGTRAFLPALMKQDEGHIVLLSSIFGLISPPGQAVYSATKFGLRGFGGALRLELSGHGIGVTTVFPGNVDTSIIEHATTPSESERLRAQSLTEHRAVPPERVAKAIVNGIKRNSPRVFVGAGVRSLERLARIAPDACQRFVGWIDARSG